MRQPSSLDVPAEGLALSSQYKISDNTSRSNITFDMSRQYYPLSIIGYPIQSFAIASYGSVGAIMTMHHLFPSITALHIR